METITQLFNFLRPRPEDDLRRAADEVRKQELIEKLARAIIARRLQAPASLFLELNRPLGFVVSQMTLFARPFLSFFLPPEEVAAAAEILADPVAFEALLVRLGEAPKETN